jgi:hypothetical protein
MRENIHDFFDDAETVASCEVELKTSGANLLKKLKELMSKACILAYFDPKGTTKVVADVSPVGPGAVLIQEQGKDQRVICHASRSLSDVVRRYSQTEKEALALVWACERFHI